MPNYVTYVSLSMNPESAPVKEILKQLTKNSWTPVWGQYDFAYEWTDAWNPAKANGYWRTINKTQNLLKRLNVNYSFHTYPKGKTNGWVTYPK